MKYVVEVETMVVYSVEVEADNAEDAEMKAIAEVYGNNCCEIIRDELVDTEIVEVM